MTIVEVTVIIKATSPMHKSHWLHVWRAQQKNKEIKNYIDATTILIRGLVEG